MATIARMGRSAGRSLVAGALAGGTALLVAAAFPAAGASGLAAQAPDADAAGWRQGVHYTIEARLDEEAQVLRSAAVLAYRNGAPDPLDRLYFHLYLNAFRPGSVWAATEERPEYDFSSLADPDHGYERVRSVRLLEGPGAPDGPGGPAGFAAGEMGLELLPHYPHAPDSTVAYVELPEPLPPGAELELRLAWDARPSTLCRRQCRQGRHWDLAQWYPRIAVFEAGGWETRPLYPQGEFYGEFAAYDVTLDLADDQVVGATGVPLEGDPGFHPVAGSEEPLLQRNWYGERLEPRSPGLLDGAPAAGRKRVRFYAEDVHHFAWSVDPDYRYEGGELAPDGDRERPVAIHVLYRPGGEDEWGSGTAVERTKEALAWLEDLFGPYPWPQLTNLHRLEGGGTEFPMLIMDGSASLGLIVHETAHQYAHGILANNEWREAWLDEGMASYLTNTFFEERGSSPWPPNIRNAVEFERARAGDYRPVSTPSEEFRDFGTYGMMAYTKPSVVLYMLRGLVGEETFREILRTYYARHRLSHVAESDFREAAEEVSGRELGWFFDQWLHTTATLDYGIEEATVERTPEGLWRTRVVVTREGEAWMPVTVAVGDESRRLDSRDRRQVVEVVTPERPESVELDPAGVLLDVDPSNDSRELPPG